MPPVPLDIVSKSLVAGLFASVACGLGALPLIVDHRKLEGKTGLGYAFAGGLMFAASVYNLILPGLTSYSNEITLRQVAPVLAGILLGTLFIWLTGLFVSHRPMNEKFTKRWGGTAGILIIVAMGIHSIPEGVAVGVGYASGDVYGTDLGRYIAVAIAIHNIPEGLAVAIPLRAAGASIGRCFFAAFLTSLPQPIAAVPASVLSWIFQPLMPLLMGFAAGAMIFLVLQEMLPDAFAREKPSTTAWVFIHGFCLMILMQVAI